MIYSSKYNPLSKHPANPLLVEYRHYHTGGDSVHRWLKDRRFRERDADHHAKKVLKRYLNIFGYMAKPKESRFNSELLKETFKLGQIRALQDAVKLIEKQKVLSRNGIGWIPRDSLGGAVAVLVWMEESLRRGENYDKS